MPIIELIDYRLPPLGSGSGISGIGFALNRGDVCTIDTDHPDDGRTFLRALATLVRPLQGTYVFEGIARDWRTYDTMRSCKQKIAYVSPAAALISNMNLRQNLLLQRYYHENRLDIDLAQETLELCAALGLKDKLDRRPAMLNAMEIQAAIIIREITKKPLAILIDQPEGFIGHAQIEQIVRIFNQLIADRMPIVFLSFDHRLMQRFANRTILIARGALTIRPVAPDSGNGPQH